MKFSQLVITPQMAKNMLTRNKNNRNLSMRTVENYAKDMRAGHWQVNGESIKIGKDGSLLDGQHRLSAVIKSGIPVPLVLIEDIDNDSFFTIDTGKKRTAGQIAQISGEKNGNRVAGIARMIRLLELGKESYFVSGLEIQETIERYPLIREWAAFGVGCRILTSGMIAPGILFAEIYPKEKIYDFYARLNSGENIGKENPIYELRQRIIGLGPTDGRNSQRMRVILTIKALKAHCTGKKIKSLRWRADEEFPTIP